jgi:hypothetical protein
MDYPTGEILAIALQDVRVWREHRKTIIPGFLEMK